MSDYTYEKSTFLTEGIPTKDELLMIDALLFSVYGWTTEKIKRMKLKSAYRWTEYAKKRMTWGDAFKLQTFLTPKKLPLWKRIFRIKF